MPKQIQSINVEVNQSFMEQLTPQMYIELFEILKINFKSQFTQYETKKASAADLNEQISIGQSNLRKLKQIKASHQQAKNKLLTAKQELDIEYQRLKQQWKNI